MDAYEIPAGQPTLTVGELRKLMEGLPDDTQVTVDLQELDVAPGHVPPEWVNVNRVLVPNFEEQFSLMLYSLDTFDARQF